MKNLLLLFLLCSFSGFCQDTGELWTGLTVKRKLSSNWATSIELNNRVYEGKAQLFYPELSLRYKVFKMMSASIDYRGLTALNKYGNYKFSNRINLNLDLEKEIKRLTVELRLRYQYEATGFRSTATYSPEFDQALRFKPGIRYDIKKSRFSPSASVEWFFNPMNGVEGHQFSKIRVSAGTDISLKGPHEISITFLYSSSLQDYKQQYILSLGYKFDWKSKKK